ncbi:hypothetical protein [Streptomyces filamentosus]|uniref:hypothetical protein n=1 Tax=Streptomyces filamentosus TaxID=67294 RepID=UPI00331A21B6
MWHRSSPAASPLPAKNVFAGGFDEAVPPEGSPPPPSDGRSWNGPPLHGKTLSRESAEWSCDAVGWLAATVADSAAHVGIRTPALLTVVRA